MTHPFASQQWIDAVWAELRGDELVRSHGSTWAYGPVLILVDTDEKASFNEPAAFRLELHQGEARHLRQASAADLNLSPTAIRAPFPRWKAALQGKEDLVDGILRGSFRMKGDLPTLTRHRDLISSVLGCAGRVPTSWQDEAAGTPAGATR